MGPQTNLNMLKKMDDSAGFRDILNHARNQKIEISGRGELKIPMPNSNLASPQMSGAATLQVVSPHLAKLAQYRESSNRRSRFSTNTAPLGLFKTPSSIETPENLEKIEENTAQPDTKMADQQKKKKRAASLSSLRSHLQEDASTTKFPSLLRYII